MYTTQRHSACSESVGGPSDAARGAASLFRRAHDGGRKSLRRRRRSAGGRSDRCTTSPLPHNAAQRHVSPSAARSSAPRAVSRILVTTSGELILLPVGGPAPHTERRSTPAHEVQRFRHSAIVFAHLPGISHIPSPKWRLKLLPVPVLTRNFDFSHPVSY